MRCNLLPAALVYLFARAGTPMQKLLEGLIGAFFRGQGKVPSPLFVESARRYLEPSGCVADDEQIDAAVKARSYTAYLMCRRLRKGGTARLVCYVLASICAPVSVAAELNRMLKKGALGLEVSYFTETSIILLRDRVDTHLYGAVFQIYQNACIYRKLRTMAEFHSKAHLSFYEVVRGHLKDYERCVTEQEEDVLSFYAGMYSAYIVLQIIHQLNECFRDNPKRPFDFLKLNFHSNHRFYESIIRSSCMHMDSCLRGFLTQGDFVDVNSEFFICRAADAGAWERFTIDFGLVPYFISSQTAEKILYIGKCIALLNEHAENAVQQEGAMLGVLGPNLDGEIDEMLEETNRRMDVLLDGMKIYRQIEGARRVFLFGRGDFAETLFLFLKDTKRISRKSFTCILEAAVRNTYGEMDEFSSCLGVYLVDNENRYENFALFCHVDHPASLVLTKEIVLKLVAVFQQLWKLKRVEHLLLRMAGTGDKGTRIQVASYTCLVYKISFFVFEETISQRWRWPRRSGMPLNDLKTGVEWALDEIMTAIEGRGIGQVLGALEGALMSAGMGAVFDDEPVQNALRGVSGVADTFLFDLHKYIRLNK